MKKILLIIGEEKERCSEENFYEVRQVPLKDIEHIELYEKELIEETKRIINTE